MPPPPSRPRPLAGPQRRAALEQRRLRAADWFSQGLGQAEVARRLRVSRSAVSVWHAAWQRHGAAGLKSLGPSGCPPKLTVAARQRIEEALLRGPRVFGYATDLWAIERVSAVIKKVARVRYAPRSAWYVLGSLGWSCQKPTARARERDERAIARWRKMTWPAIQKSGSGPRPA